MCIRKTQVLNQSHKSAQYLIIISPNIFGMLLNCLHCLLFFYFLFSLKEKSNKCVRVLCFLVLSTTSGVLYLWSILKLILGEWQDFLCVLSQSFYEQGNLPYPAVFQSTTKMSEGPSYLEFNCMILKVSFGLLASGPVVCQRRITLQGRGLALKKADQRAW